VSYSFRIRFNLPTAGYLPFDEERRFLTSGATDAAVAIASGRLGKSLRAADRIVVTGGGFATQLDAQSAGSQWRSRLEHVFATTRIPADFGDRSPSGSLSEPFRRALLEQGHVVINDVHGLMTYPSEPTPGNFVSGSASGIAAPTQQSVEAALTVITLGNTWSPLASLAYDLYSKSYFVESADARFLLLMVAVETLIEQKSRTPAAEHHVERLIEATKGNDLLTKPEVDSLVGALKQLRQESIGAAGKRLASQLERRSYADMSPAHFFTQCYNVRSQLVHGSGSKVEDVNTLVGPLDLFVSHLLAGDEVLERLYSTTAGPTITSTE